MKTMARHWPLLLVGILWIGCIADFAWHRGSGADSLELSILFYGLLMPVSAFITSLWYGSRMSSRAKWLIPVMCGVAAAVTVALGLDEFMMLSCAELGGWCLLNGLAGMLIGSGIFALSEP